jgi:hypothetical protein
MNSYVDIKTSQLFPPENYIYDVIRHFYIESAEKADLHVTRKDLMYLAENMKHFYADEESSKKSANEILNDRDEVDLKFSNFDPSEYISLKVRNLDKFSTLMQEVEI